MISEYLVLSNSIFSSWFRSLILVLLILSVSKINIVGQENQSKRRSKQTIIKLILGNNDQLLILGKPFNVKKNKLYLTIVNDKTKEEFLTKIKLDYLSSDVRDIIMTKNGEYLISGSYKCSINGDLNGFIITLDTALNSKKSPLSFDLGFDEVINRIYELDNGNYLVIFTQSKKSCSVISNKVFSILYDNEWNQLLKKEFVMPSGIEYVDLIIDKFNNFHYFLNYLDDNHINRVLYSKISSDGMIRVDHTINRDNTTSFICNDVCLNSDGTISLVGTTEIDVDNQYSLCLFKIKENAEIVYKVAYVFNQPSKSIGLGILPFNINKNLVYGSWDTIRGIALIVNEKGKDELEIRTNGTLTKACFTDRGNICFVGNEYRKNSSHLFILFVTKMLKAIN
jgi:hypothetical protein